MRPSKETTAVELGGPTIGGDGGPEGPIPAGTVLGRRYRLLELLGGGGMGVVYRARDLELGEDLALKLLPAELAADPRRVEAFRDEIRLARKITHPNVCRVYDLVEAGDHLVITMELIEGETLSAVLRRETALDEARALPILREVAAGLAAAHAAGVVHRDLKPSNIMLRSGGQAVLADFGVAVRGGDRDVDIAGTRGYMAPEQLAGAPLSPRTDVYALGILAYRMIAGSLPDPGPTSVSHTAEIAGEPMEAPTALPGQLGPFVAACTALDPAARPADGTAAWQLLASIAAPPTPAPAPARRRRWPLVAAILAIAGIAGGVLLYRARSRSYRDHPPVACNGMQVITLDGVSIEGEVAIRATGLCEITVRRSRLRGSVAAVAASGRAEIRVVDSVLEAPIAVDADGAAEVSIDGTSRIQGSLKVDGIAEIHHPNR